MGCEVVNFGICRFMGVPCARFLNTPSSLHSDLNTREVTFYLQKIDIDIMIQLEQDVLPPRLFHLEDL